MDPLTIPVTKTISISSPRPGRIDYLLNGQSVCTVEDTPLGTTIRWASLGEVMPELAADFARIMAWAIQVTF
jgi:hypothetical protein